MTSCKISLAPFYQVLQISNFKKRPLFNNNNNNNLNNEIYININFKIKNIIFKLEVHLSIKKDDENDTLFHTDTT